MPLQQMFRCPPLTYASRLNNQRTISMPLVTQSLWEPQEAKSAQYASYSIFLLITRLDHSNPFSSVAMANHSSFRIFAMTFVYYIRLPPPEECTTPTAYKSEQQLQLQPQGYQSKQSNNLDGGKVMHIDPLHHLLTVQDYFSVTRANHF